MFNITTKNINFGEKVLKLEVGKIARQASGAVLATMGETVVLCTVVGNDKPKADVNFLPLSVHYQEKFYSAGKIPGGFLKRESKPSDRETLISRLIDRPIRPLFPENYSNEVQIICTVLSYDGENEPDVVAMAGASAALAISKVPFLEAIAGCRVAYINEEFVLNPTSTQLTSSTLDLLVAGTKTSVLMVESAAAELSEEVMLKAVMFGHENIKPIIEAITALAKEIGHEKLSIIENDISDVHSAVQKLASKKLAKAYKETAKLSRRQAVAELRDEVVAALASDGSSMSESSVNQAFDKIEKEFVRNYILEEGTRIDGRKFDSIRNITCEIDLLPRVHGAGLFTRGETQAIAITTLGTGQDAQMTDDIMGNKLEHFMLHYNFPPYSVGEVGAMRGPGRREIGHGKLALKSIKSVMPDFKEFPYVVRVVSEITESDGSSSMATVCATSLSLMSAGVPMSRHVSGIAMGLIKSGEKIAVLSDIMADEDHLGDMDFKVAGTERGITALQMDIKINGIDADIMRQALDQAKAGRHHILLEMNKIIDTPKKQLNPNAPQIITIFIDKEKIREVIGSGGKVIRDICEKSGAKVDIRDDGEVKISATAQTAIDTAIQMIKDIVSDAEYGTIYDGTVTKITDFGAFVKFLGSREGLVHISEIVDYRLEKVSDVLSEGQQLKVRVIGFERGGKVKLSIKAVTNTNLPPEPPRESRGERSGSSRGEGRGFRSEGRGDGRGAAPRGGDSRDGRGGHDRAERGGFRGERSDRGDSRGAPRSDRDGRDSRSSDGNRKFGNDRAERSDFSGEKKKRRFF